MEMTGHKTRFIFERYNIVSQTDLKDAAAKYDAALSGKMGNICGSDGQHLGSISRVQGKRLDCK